jgi:hypothetical protein
MCLPPDHEFTITSGDWTADQWTVGQHVDRLDYFADARCGMGSGMQRQMLEDAIEVSGHPGC